MSDQEWAQREGMVAFAGYPLLVDDGLVGVMAMFARHELTKATLAAMSTVADKIAIGIERKSFQERLNAQREWLAVTLASIGDAVITTVTLSSPSSHTKVRSEDWFVKSTRLENEQPPSPGNSWHSAANRC